MEDPLSGKDEDTKNYAYAKALKKLEAYNQEIRD
jgi:hypothetical protein